MTKLPRVTAKIFASNAAEGDIGQFGSALAGNKLATGDIAQIQALEAFLTGWRGAVLSNRNYPTLQEMNGLEKVFSQQIAYILEHGVPEYDAASVYYTGDIIKVLNNGVPVLKYSVVDNNLGNSVDNTAYWADLSADVPLASTSAPGIVQPDGQTITINNGIISAQAQGGADTDLSNLTSSGNAKFQFAPFSINAGSIDASGANNTLSAAGDAPVEVNRYVVPRLSANTSEYGTSSDYTWTIPNNVYTYRSTSQWTMQLAQDNYIPAGADVTFTIQSYTDLGDPGGGVREGIGIQGCKVTYTYTDDTQEVVFNENQTGNFSGWIAVSAVRNAEITIPAAPSKDVKKITVNVYPMAGYNASYITAANITFRAQYTVSSADTLICSPCTITTADGRTKTFENSSALDCSNTADGSYKVMRNYETGNLSLSSSLTVSKTEPQNPASGALWLDNSMYPLKLKEYNGSEWIINNDLIYIGDAAVSSGVITDVKNNYFNACPARRDLAESYQNGASRYAVYSDGWCEQGGLVNNPGDGTGTVTLLKSYINTDYYMSINFTTNSANHRTYIGFVKEDTKAANRFQFTGCDSVSLNPKVYWYTCGYIK